jgi:hypothetical protein
MYISFDDVDKVLMGYGFCLEDNPHDSISLKLPGDSTLYMITRNVLCPTPLLEKFRDITAIPREHESESTTRNTFVAYTALIGALLQKMASVGWDERVCDTSAGQQAGIYRASQQDLLMRSYTYIVGLSRTLLEREDGVISNNDCQRRENNGRKRRKLEADDYMSERLALLIHDGGKDFPENVRKGLLSLEEYYRSNRSDDDDEMHADARKIQKRLAKKGVQVSMDDILLAMRIWFEESVKSIIYPDVYKVVARFKGDNAAIEKELTGGPTDLVMFIDEAP